MSGRESGIASAFPFLAQKIPIWAGSMHWKETPVLLVFTSSCTVPFLRRGHGFTFLTFRWPLPLHRTAQILSTLRAITACEELLLLC